MVAFIYTRATDIEAVIQSAQEPSAMYLGGGTYLLGTAKGYIAHPARVADINHLPPAGITELLGGGMRIDMRIRSRDIIHIV